MVNFWAKLKSSTFHVPLLRLPLGQLLGKIGLLFDLASGHSVSRPTFQTLISLSLFDYLTVSLCICVG